MCEEQFLSRGANILKSGVAETLLLVSREMQEELGWRNADNSTGYSKRGLRQAADPSTATGRAGRCLTRDFEQTNRSLLQGQETMNLNQ